MKKKYVTTVTTEWDLRGDVPVEDINARIKVAMSAIMMTRNDKNYAFTNNEDVVVETKEVA